MQYILVEDRQIIHLGPINWQQRRINAELEDLGISGQVSPAESGYIRINEHLEIIPISADLTPPYDTRFQYVAGPFWNYLPNSVEMYYTVHDLDLGSIRSGLKTRVAAERYRREIQGTSVVIADQTLTIDTSRDGRNIFLQKYILMGDADTVNWKFPEGWATLTKTQLGEVVAAGAEWIQSQFDWELNKNAEIDGCTTIEELKIVEIEPPRRPHLNA